MPVRPALTLFAALIVGIIRPSPAQSSQYPQDTDPPDRVGRVSAMLGAVSLFPAGANDWTGASLNYPLSTGDALWADRDARAEIHLGSSAIRIGSQTSVSFGEVSDTVTQVRLDQGSIDVHVRYLNDNEIYEIDTPGGIVSLLAEGHYRIDVMPDGRRTVVSVRDGDASVTVNDRDYDVRPHTSVALVGTGRPPVATATVAVDDWEQWADDRDRREDAVQSTRYVSRDMVGYEDLDEYGTWQQDGSYGAVWTPRDVPAGWAPYRNGHWESVGPWGWTWIDDEPWGFAPFHYGRWTTVRGRWAWVPGPVHVRPVYAPALVAFVGGAGWGASVGVGSAAVGWVPLAPGEPFVPGYRASSRYVARVNVGSNDGRRNGNNRNGGDDMRYANRNVPGAVTAVPRDAFERSRPIARAAIPVRPSDIGTARPSPVPMAGGDRVPAPPPRAAGGDRGRDPGRGVPTPPRPAAGQPATPAPPPQWRPRPRPNEPVPPAQRPNTPDAPPPAPNPVPRPSGPPANPPPPPVTTPAPQPTQPPPGRMPPRPSGPPSQQPTPAPMPLPPPPPPAQQAPQPRPPESRPRPAAPTADQNEQAWQQQRRQLDSRHQQENADLARRYQDLLKKVPKGISTQPIVQRQQDEKKAMDERHQRERDQLDKQHRGPG